MTNITQRGDTYYFDHTLGGRRLRCSLGTNSAKAAERLANRISFAIADGPKSPIWEELKPSLPLSSFRTLTSALGVPIHPDLREFEERYLRHLSQRVRIGNLVERSRRLYEPVARRFFLEMSRQDVRKMDGITPDIVNEYCAWRREDILEHGGSGRALIFETAVMSSIFSYAIEEGVIQSSPLKQRPKIETEAQGAEPFSPEELEVLDEADKTPQEALIYALFRWTGLRCSDVADLRWKAINWTDKTLTWGTRKRGKLVTIPLVEPLMEVLRTAKIEGAEKVVGIGTWKLYKIVRNLGERNGIKSVFPHRFRDTMAVTMLEKGATIYDVAKMLGDRVGTIEKHYAPFTKQLQERVRGILES